MIHIFYIEMNHFLCSNHQFTVKKNQIYLLTTRYRPAYKAFRSDSSFNFMVFFMIFFFQFLVLIYQAVGVHGSGYCGFITAVKQFDGTWTGILFGILTLAVAISLAVCAAGSFLLITKVRPNSRTYLFRNFFVQKKKTQQNL